uniref:Ribosomal protein S6 kinase related n=1 Tax=Amphiprion percula TaxID=161767 RepID=A0A3P8SN14_AMPPE
MSECSESSFDDCNGYAIAAAGQLYIPYMGQSRIEGLLKLGHSAVFSQPVEVNDKPSDSKLLLPLEDAAETSEPKSTPPAFISVFLPEFPLQVRRKEITVLLCSQILGFVAKGSFGPILKVKDVCKEKVYAVKVLPKSEILKQGVLEQSKEEVIIQRHLEHPFIHNLQDCWQTQRHLFIMCDYCSTGDLYTCWLLKGQFGEDEVQLFAAEMGSALGFLHDLGIMHRDIKHGGRAFTICGTIQYMAPEVLSGGPYSHAADWWSLGIMLFSLVTGEFPLPAEQNHSSMLDKVRDFPYFLPTTLSSALNLLLTELLCKNPLNRLRNLVCFQMQPFFRGSSFDSYILQKTPVNFILELRTHPDWEEYLFERVSLQQHNM